MTTFCIAFYQSNLFTVPALPQGCLLYRISTDETFHRHRAPIFLYSTIVTGLPAIKGTLHSQAPSIRSHRGKSVLKGHCREIFCFWFFSWISFPPAPEYPIRTISNCSGNWRRYSQVKVHHRYQRHRWQNLPPISTTPTANFATSFTSVVDTGGKFATSVSEQYQPAEAIKWTCRQKCVYKLILLPKGVQTKWSKLSW